MKILILIMILLVAKESFCGDYILWNKWSIDTRIGWVLGFKQGNIFLCAFSTEENSKKLKQTPQDYYNNCLKRNVENINPVVLQEIMTNLYRDPSNYNLSTMDIYYTAVAKAIGDDYEYLLKEYRKKAFNSQNKQNK